MENFHTNIRNSTWQKRFRSSPLRVPASRVEPPTQTFDIDAVEGIGELYSCSGTSILTVKRTTMRANIRRYEDCQSTRELLMCFDFDRTSSIDRGSNWHLQVRFSEGDGFDIFLAFISQSDCFHKASSISWDGPWDDPPRDSKARPWVSILWL
ncbi:hypothetical protein K440DRAFT_284483 [Wilcoxina mikolae CBS 423.85]|nr:hypothetical protein K440DRAFT_284483 [Wilcoxina mikolae CBS 423.85]